MGGVVTFDGDTLWTMSSLVLKQLFYKVRAEGTEFLRLVCAMTPEVTRLAGGCVWWRGLWTVCPLNGNSRRMGRYDRIPAGRLGVCILFVFVVVVLVVRSPRNLVDLHDLLDGRNFCYVLGHLAGH